MFTLNFETGNAAFDEYADAEVRRILEKIADDVSNGIQKGSVIDINGNKIGYWELD